MTKRSTEKHGDLTLRSEVVSGRETGRWIIDIPARISATGKRQRIRLASKTAARDRARKMLKEYRLSVALSAKGHSGWNFGDVLPRWVEREKVKVAAGQKKKSSLKTDLYALWHLEAFFGDRDLSEITTDRFTEYQAHRVKAGAKPVTINTERRKLIAVLTWCTKERILDRVPELETMQERRIDPEMPTVEEMSQIISEMRPHARLLFRLLVETGLRSGEAKKIRWENVDLETGSVNIVDHAGWTPKTQHSYRTVYFGQGLAEEFRQLDRTSQWLFPSLRDPTIHIVDFRKELKSAIIRAGVQRHGRPIHVTPKTARKWFSTYQALGTGNLSLVKRQMGHSPNSRVTEAHYIHIPDAELQAATLETTLRSQPRWLGESETIWQDLATQKEDASASSV